MPNQLSLKHDEERSRQRVAEHERQPEHDLSQETTSQGDAQPYAVLPLGKAFSGRGNASVHATSMLHAQRTQGNKAVQRAVANQIEKPSTKGSTSVPVQRAFWNFKDMENDFWGTKELLGNKWGGVADAGMSAAWNLGGAIPGFGTAEGLVGAGIDGLKSLYTSGGSIAAAAMGNTAEADDLNKAAGRFGHDMEFSAMSAIPIWGTGQGVVSGLWDAASAVDRATGGKPAPLSGDIWDQASPL